MASRVDSDRSSEPGKSADALVGSVASGAATVAAAAKLPAAWTGEGTGAAETASTRDLFWQNVMREILTSLSVMKARRRAEEQAAAQLRAVAQTVPAPVVTRRRGSAGGKPDGAGAKKGSSAPRETAGSTLPAGDPNGPAGGVDDPFDGRMAVLTKAGERIAIADVYPLFACGIDSGPAERMLSIAVECSVFQIHTPDGQVFTLPLQEMRGFHALTPELMAQLERAAQEQAAEESGESKESKTPFGFAAFTSLARSAKGKPGIKPRGGSPVGKGPGVRD